jgi:uncharacterized protein with PIN domain
MGEGDRVSVYPMFETFDIGAQLRVRPEPLRVPRFIADAHLGGLARYLRMLGFDTLYDNAWTDDEIRSRASDERRTVLTRDRALLMCASVTHGCYVHARAPKAQLVEIVQRLQLGACAKPFTLCLHCNLPLAPADPANLPQWIPPSVTARHRHFDACAACGRIYWQGSHWERMRTLLNDLLPDGIGPDAPRENIASDAATRLSDIPGSPP